MRKTLHKERKQVRGNVVVAHGQLETESTFETPSQCTYFNCLKRISKNGKKNKHRCLVFDNLETIVNNETLMKTLADYLILLDDPEYAKLNVKVILVGVPHGVRSYFRRVTNMESVANRIREIPEVARLTTNQVETLAAGGFNQCRLTFDPSIRSRVFSHINFVTDRLPQRIHEYCFELADESLPNNLITLQNLRNADRRWLRSSLLQAYEIVVGAMNRRKKETGKRNQVMFALGQIETDEFTIADVNEAVFASFYASSNGAIKFSSANSLRELATRNNPIITKTPNSGSYRFVDPRYRMAIRACLRKEPPLGVVALETDAL